MLCERCRAEIKSDPLPEELEEALGPAATVSRRIIECLWRHRGRWVTHERLVNFVYDSAGERSPLAADNCIAVCLSRVLRPRLPAGYMIEAQWGGRRLIVSPWRERLSAR